VPATITAVQVVERNDPAAVERLLRGLPAWFGIEESLRDYVERARTLLSWLAVRDHEVVGVLLAARHFPDAAEVVLMAVPPERHRQGTGTALLAAAERQLRADGVRLLQVKTLGPSRAHEGYAATRRFYAARGFLSLEELDDLWPGNPCLVMVKMVG